MNGSNPARRAFAPLCALLLCLPALAQIPDTFTNLKVLPQDIEKSELIGVMRGFASALGVRCNHCHVGEDAATLQGFDFASDEIESKQAARVMLEMTRAINAEYVPQVAHGDEAQVEVKCMTCHRGQTEPWLIQDVLEKSLDEGGVAAVDEKYTSLRDEYYGRHTYDFGEFVLTSMAERAANVGDMDAARQMLEMNLEYFPESEYTHMLLGQVLMRQGDREGAIAAFEKILEMNPENTRAQRMLERLQQTASEDG